MAQPFEMMSTADLIGASVQEGAAAAVIQGRYRQRPGRESQRPELRQGSFNLRKAPAQGSLIESMILDKTANAGSRGGPARLPKPPRQGLSLRKGGSAPRPQSAGASPPGPQSLPQSSASGAAHGSPAAGSAAGSELAKPAAPDKKPLSKSEAACRIQRFVRKKKSPRSKWFQLIELRKQFIDAEVVNPGEFYNDDNLLAREALKSDPNLKAALATLTLTQP